jgi:hypothetical protein
MKPVNEVRESHKDLAKEINGVTAVIVKTYYSARKYALGVQYWTNEEIKADVTTNTHGGKSIFIEKL